MLTTSTNTTSTPSDPAKDLSGLSKHVEVDQLGQYDQDLPEVEHLKEEFGEGEDTFFKLNLPDSYRIFFEYDYDIPNQDFNEMETKKQLNHELLQKYLNLDWPEDKINDDNGEYLDGEAEFDDDFHLPESYRIFFAESLTPANFLTDFSHDNTTDIIGTLADDDNYGAETKDKLVCEESSGSKCQSDPNI